MKQKRSLALLVATSALYAASSHAAIIYSDVAYGVSASQMAEWDFLGQSSLSITETFDDNSTLSTSGAIGSSSGSGDQNRWLEAADSFGTSVGTFSMTAKEAGAGSDDNASSKLMLESDNTGEFGRQQNYGSNWLDSNDADAVTWTIGSSILTGANAFGFYLSDANDQGASLKLVFDDGTEHIEQLNNPLSNGNLMYATFISDALLSSATLLFDNGSYENDGWGIDNITLAYIPVPEPTTLALLGLGLVGLGAARRRKV